MTGLRALTSLPALLVLATLGCAAPKGNPSFDVTVPRAQKILTDMRQHPKPLQRPLVILSGFCDPGIAAGHLRGEFRRLTGDERVIGVSFLFCGDFDDCRRRVIEAVDRAFPSGNPQWTSEVDVVGVSMGGLVGRYAAAPRADDPTARRLRVARLFTISSPHRGAALAGMPTLSRLQIAMRHESTFMRQLVECEASNGVEYPIVPYARLGDVIVGAENAAPVGQNPWWVPAEPLQDSHLMAMMDARIIADVALRLRGETPLTRDPAEPLPTQGRPEDQAVCNPSHGTSFASR